MKIELKDSIMTQEQKELLFKDLCSRLPYGLKLKITSKESKNRIVDLNEDNICHLTNDWWNDYKPYLFPLSSMTKEQKEELENLGWHFDNFEIHNVNECLGTYKEYVAHLDCFALIDWLNKNHFDYRGLILMGLAIDATNLDIY